MTLVFTTVLYIPASVTFLVHKILRTWYDICWELSGFRIAETERQLERLCGRDRVKYSKVK